MYNQCFQIKTTKTFSSVDNTRYKKVHYEKQRLYEKLLKTRTAKSEAECKTYKNMFEAIKLSDMVKHELRVASYELRVTSYELKA